MPFPLIPFALFGGLIYLALRDSGDGGGAAASPVPYDNGGDFVDLGVPPAGAPASGSSPSQADKDKKYAADLKAYNEAITKKRADGRNDGRIDGYYDSQHGTFPHPDPNKHMGAGWVKDAQDAYSSGYMAGYSEGNAEYAHDAEASSSFMDS